MASRPPYRVTFRRLLGFLRPYKLSLWVSVVLAAASQGTAIAMKYTATAQPAISSSSAPQISGAVRHTGAPAIGAR